MMSQHAQPRDLRLALIEARRQLHDSAKISLPEPGRPTLDLSESRIFLLARDGTLDIDALLHPDDYGDLIRWRAGIDSIKASTLVVLGFFAGAVAATLISLIAR